MSTWRRIADHVARAGQTVVSERLRDMVAPRLGSLGHAKGGLRFGEGREVEMKGLSRKHRVFEVRWD